MQQTAQIVNFHGYATLVDHSKGWAPYFSMHVSRAIHQKKACNVVVTGEAGAGKSYMAIDICRVLEGITKTGNDRFKLKQVVYRYQNYMQLILKLRMGKAIMFDEPSYAISHRDWYKEANKVLTRTMESQRFKIHPVFIPVINKALLDKTIRSYLIQYQIHVLDRGRAIVYRISPGQHKENIYRITVCNLRYFMFDWLLCPKDSCLGCKKLTAEKDPCMIFRAQYERKKDSVQTIRYEQASDQAAQQESKLLTDDQLEILILKIRKLFTRPDGSIDIDLLRIAARRRLKIKIAHNRAYRLAKMLRFDYPELFD